MIAVCFILRKIFKIDKCLKQASENKWNRNTFFVINEMYK